MKITDQLKKGIKSQNQEFRRYEQVHKNQNYYLSEQPDQEEFDNDFAIKTVDFSLFRDDNPRFVAELGSALEEIGFAILSNHGIDQNLYHQCEKKIIEFFESTTLDDRLKYEASRFGSVNQGFFPVRKTTIIHPDLVEGWVFCRRAFNMDDDPNFKESDYWPIPEFEPFFRKIVKNHEKLILPLMQSMLTFLGSDATIYDEKLTKTNFGFRLNYYPPLTKDQLDSGGGRMLGHEDIDIFTILPTQSVTGLQVLNRKNNKWIRLNPKFGDIILNTGDYMQRISNDIFPSTTHRVSPPVESELTNEIRVSYPMAIYVWEDEILEVLPNLENPKYEPIRAEKFHTSITSKYYGDEYSKDVK
jgi:isopenicillin N synthase-like dioxygenase